MVGIPVVLNLWLLRAQSRPVQNWNDGAVHVALIRRAWSAWSAGQFPIDAWLDSFTTGFPVFHHYQTLPHVLMGLVGGAVGPARAYSWSLYLLLAAWPISVYLGGRLMGWSRSGGGRRRLPRPVVGEQDGDLRRLEAGRHPGLRIRELHLGRVGRRVDPALGHVAAALGLGAGLAGGGPQRLLRPGRSHQRARRSPATSSPATWPSPPWPPG